MNKLVQTNELKTDYWEYLFKQQGIKPILSYDDVLDTLFIHFSPGETDRVITHLIDLNVALLYRHSDKEIVGMKIENFQMDFLPGLPEARVWKLSDAGVELNGICDIVFVVEREENHKIPNRIAREVKALEPVFA